MTPPSNHVPKKDLIEFINTNLYIDDMIAIDRHLETCDKCKKQYERLLNSSGPYSKLLKYLIISVLILTTISIIGYLLKNTVYFENTEPVIKELPLLTDTISSEIEKDSSVVNSQLETSPQEAINTSQEIEETSASQAESNISIPQEEEEEININENINDQNPQISTEKQSKPKKTINIESNISSDQTETEETSGNIGFKVSSVKKRSASPITGYTSYNRYLTKSIDQLILPINGIEESSLVISFDVQEDKSLSNFKIKSSSNKMYAESMIDVIKSGPKWQLYHSPEDSTIVINQAEISIDMTN